MPSHAPNPAVRFSPPNLPVRANVPNSGTSRRQRLLGFARATRDTYIPRIATSVTLLASGVSRSVEYDEYGSPISFPKGTTFTLFPSYTRPVDETNGKGYVVTVRGWMWCPGLMTRKNRLILSLAKQITRYGGEAAQQAVNRLEYDPRLELDTDESLDSDSISLASSNASMRSENSDSVIKDRLSSFIARSIPNAQISITIGSVDTAQALALVDASCQTDSNGHFEAEVFVPYQPAVVQVTAVADDTVCSFQEIRLVSVSGYGVISDIDDTVKLTGVVGDKRELMHRLLLGEILSWNIPPVVAWFNILAEQSDVTFHYVSNSPWQLFTLIHQYFDTVKLPPGSVHLKQYTGNIIASLMEPTSSRKKKSLSKIVDDFPLKSFICVGDSGEQDLEAYADLAKSFPGRIKAIYIRAVPESFSDVEDAPILAEIRWLIDDFKRRQLAKPRPPVTESTPDLIDLSSSPELAAERLSKLPPLIPKKPNALKGNLVKAPPLPARKYLEKAPTENLELAKASSASAPPLPKRSTTTPAVSPAVSPAPRDNKYAFDNLNFYELEESDRKGALWLERISSVLHELEGTGTKVVFFQDGDEAFFKDTLRDLN